MVPRNLRAQAAIGYGHSYDIQASFFLPDCLLGAQKKKEEIYFSPTQEQRQKYQTQPRRV